LLVTRLHLLAGKPPPPPDNFFLFVIIPDTRTQILKQKWWLCSDSLGTCPHLLTACTPTNGFPVQEYPLNQTTSFPRQLHQAGLGASASATKSMLSLGLHGDTIQLKVAYFVVQTRARPGPGEVVFMSRPDQFHTLDSLGRGDPRVRHTDLSKQLPDLTYNHTC
jgi:hypothetical protein